MAATRPEHERKREQFNRECDATAKAHQQGMNDMKTARTYAASPSSTSTRKNRIRKDAQDLIAINNQFADYVLGTVWSGGSTSWNDPRSSTLFAVTIKDGKIIP